MSITGALHSGYDGQTVQIDTNLSASAFRAVAFDSSDENVVNLATDGSDPSFVLVFGGESVGSASNVVDGVIATAGQFLAKAGASIDQGDYLMPTTGGAWIPVTSTNYYGCQALENAASGDVIRVRIESGYFEAA